MRSIIVILLLSGEIIQAESLTDSNLGVSTSQIISDSVIELNKPYVTAMVDTNQISIPDKTKYTLVIHNAKYAAVPADIKVPNLRIRKCDKLSETNIINSKNDIVDKYIYEISSEKEGRYIIPSFDILIANTYHQTPPITLSFDNRYNQIVKSFISDFSTNIDYKTVHSLFEKLNSVSQYSETWELFLTELVRKGLKEIRFNEEKALCFYQRILSYAVLSLDPSEKNDKEIYLRVVIERIKALEFFSDNGSEYLSKKSIQKQIDKNKELLNSLNNLTDYITVKQSVDKEIALDSLKKNVIDPDAHNFFTNQVFLNKNDLLIDRLEKNNQLLNSNPQAQKLIAPDVVVIVDILNILAPYKRIVSISRGTPEQNSKFKDSSQSSMVYPIRVIFSNNEFSDYAFYQDLFMNWRAILTNNSSK